VRHGEAGVGLEFGRRILLRAGCTLSLGASPLFTTTTAATASVPSASDRATLDIRPRRDWDGGRGPIERLPLEAGGDVRYLTIHHSASSNIYSADDVPGIIHSFFDSHINTKGWPDVAYNFFVDRYGKAWEGRTGSLTGPVIPDATGGYQGYSQLCCLIGDHQRERPTDAALGTLGRLLAELATRYEIDTRPNASTTFVSRGSNLWPQGKLVSTPTIVGHRDMSRTLCPGDTCYSLIRSEIAPLVHQLRQGPPTPTPSISPAESTSPAYPEPISDQGNEIPTGSLIGLGVAAAAATASVLLAAIRGRARQRAE
jgi:hypothetical protein